MLAALAPRMRRARPVSDHAASGLSAGVSVATPARDRYPPGRWAGEVFLRLTDAGRAALEQIQGLCIRAVGTLVNAFDDRRVDETIFSFHDLGEALEDLHSDTGRPQAVAGTGS